jgi:hypothetical protein
VGNSSLHGFRNLQGEEEGRGRMLLWSLECTGRFGDGCADCSDEEEEELLHVGEFRRLVSRREEKEVPRRI